MKTGLKLTLVLALALMWSDTPLAQTPSGPSRSLSVGTNTFGVRTMDFDLWCQQTQRYVAERCAQRRPEDLQAFENYRASIERYELDYLKQVQRDQQFRSLTNRDPSQTVTQKQNRLP